MPSRTPKPIGDGRFYVELTRGEVAFISECDVETVAAYSWCCDPRKNQKYAKAGINKRIVYLHRLLVGQEGFVVDHIDGNGLNNCRDNLRVATPSQNNWNSKNPYGESRFKGVSRSSSKLNPWRAAICQNNQRIEIGIFADEESAALAYNEHAIQLFGEFASLNEVCEVPKKRHHANRRTGFYGVIPNRYGTFDVRVWLIGQGRAISGGVYRTAEEGARAYDRIKFEMYGTNAKFNFPDEVKSFVGASA